MRAPKTVEEAKALREIDTILDASKIFVFGASGLDGDSICAFVDDDGVSKKIECIRNERCTDEWVKVRI